MGFSQNVKRLIDDNALSAIEIKELEDYSGTNIVVNGNMSVHRYIVALNKVKLMDKNGEITNHLQGLWQKVIQMMTLGVKPIYVFDGPKSRADYEVSPRDTREVMEQNIGDSKKIIEDDGYPNY
jgi:flap endonuclease-1